jgi:hypothetical protein
VGTIVARRPANTALEPTAAQPHEVHEESVGRRRLNAMSLGGSRMTAFQERWTRIAERFGLKIRIAFQIDIGGEHLTVPVLLEDFGARRGMVLVTSFKEINAVAEQLASAGFGYSCLGEPRDQEIDEPYIIDMLRDWGWSGSGDAPNWYGKSGT